LTGRGESSPTDLPTATCPFGGADADPLAVVAHVGRADHQGQVRAGRHGRVRRAGTVVDSRLTVATLMPAPPEVGIELLEHLRGDSRQRNRPESRLDRPLDVAAVPVEGGLLGLVRAQPRVQDRFPVSGSVPA
jgi:hypothetical protein